MFTKRDIVYKKRCYQLYGHMGMVVSSREGKAGEGTKSKKQDPKWRWCDGV